MRIRTDDTVQVISGKEKGKQGKVLRTDPKAGTVYVEDLNMIKRHQRAQPSPDGRGQGKEGGIIEMEGPIHVSNVALVDPTDNKPTRIGVRITDDGVRQRYSKRTGEAI
ncbi:MAG TPA: 50S ribosomal protein L24 [Solirubrobacterales bacterium]|jgi:large subunit ribosomal protein L24|nr:50S ribosomal protein L24 [Solirubrobacterales bacterium]HMU26728.1 50S ribosomal protein L24 [Solirubrobacterales bacterium]HMW44265.1 50S ribosomal protein L24 [Solirubrobacterales bacterium]HMX70953.1 50S ribosomal protein L24 [Solirubrobacterales bacterium]HMY26107.1 50S ribosomal protein L24 [Solirubrobacterales bacterium]